MNDTVTDDPWYIQLVPTAYFAAQYGPLIDQINDGVYQRTNGTLSFPLVIQSGKPSGFMSVNATWGTADQ